MSCKVIAELSSNHMGDISLAKKMILAAKENGADYVKFQTWHVKNLKPGPWDHDGRREIYKKAELQEEDYKELVTFCEQSKIKFLTSCFAVNDLPFIRSISKEVKIPSCDCANKELVYRAIELFDIVYISTGCTTSAEYVPYSGYSNVYLLHCVSSYPCPAEQVNLEKVLYLKVLTPRYGYSGHYFGIWDAIGAISLGCKVIEKHFTIDRKLPFRDNKFAILPHELKQISEYRDNFDLMMIDKGWDYQECETEVREHYAGRWSGNS